MPAPARVWIVRVVLFRGWDKLDRFDALVALEMATVHRSGADVAVVDILPPAHRAGDTRAWACTQADRLSKAEGLNAIAAPAWALEPRGVGALLPIDDLREDVTTNWAASR